MILSQRQANSCVKKLGVGSQQNEWQQNNSDSNTTATAEQRLRSNSDGLVDNGKGKARHLLCRKSTRCVEKGLWNIKIGVWGEVQFLWNAGVSDCSGLVMSESEIRKIP